MTNEITTATGTIAIYACGGSAVNIAGHFEAFREKDEPGFAKISTTYIDTSKSNLMKTLDPKSIYVFDGLDGSGKVRAENHVKIGECVLDILNRHKPADLNVVLSSGGGGSGSVIAPSIVSELLNRGTPTIVIVVGSTDSRIELENTIKTLKSYENIARTRGIPVVAMYYENSKEQSRDKVDEQVQASIVLLSALFSKQNKELDSSDLNNWLNYCKVTSYDAHLAYMDFYPKEVIVDRPSTVISVATLTTQSSETRAGCMVDYQCVGYVKQDVMASIKFDNPIHAAIIDGAFADIHKRLAAAVQELDDAKKARISSGSILSANDKPSTNGLIL